MKELQEQSEQDTKIAAEITDTGMSERISVTENANQPHTYALVKRLGFFVAATAITGMAVIASKYEYPP